MTGQVCVHTALSMATKHFTLETKLRDCVGRGIVRSMCCTPVGQDSSVLSVLCCGSTVFVVGWGEGGLDVST